jgi:hypothetical protein
MKAGFLFSLSVVGGTYFMITVPTTDRRKLRIEHGSVAGAFRVFSTFFLLGPAIAAAIQLLLLNLLLLAIFLKNSSSPVPDRTLVVAMLICGMELSGVTEAVLIFFFGLPASFMVAASATASYFVGKRVSIIAVVAAVVAAMSFEGLLARGTYFDYLASHGVRGPMIPGELRTENPIPLSCVLHILPALMCWWLVRGMRKITPDPGHA